MATASELDERALADLRERYRVTVPSTHWHDCYQSHPFCAIARLCDELSAARQEATKAREDAGWAIAWIGKLAVAAGMDDDEGQTTSPEGFAIWLRDQHDGYVETMADLRAARQRIAELEGELAERVRLCEVCDAPIYIGGFCVISPSDGGSLHCCSESCLAIAAGRVRLAMALGDAATPAAREGEG